MAISSKVFGQQKPAGATDTDLFVVASGKQAQVSIFACNQSASADTYRIAIIPSGDTLSGENYIAYDISLSANSSDNYTSLCLNAGDKVVIRSGSGNVSFTATGLEIA